MEDDPTTNHQDLLQGEEMRVSVVVVKNDCSLFE